MVTYLEISGFKSFHDFKMEFTPLTVVAGLNASGKSNLFDALMLLSRLAEVRLKDAFKEQRGDFDELFTKYDEDKYAQEISFTVEMLINRHIKDAWGTEAELNYTRLRYKLIIERKENASGIEDLLIRHESLEKIKPQDDKWVKKQKIKKDLWSGLRAGGSPEPFIKTDNESNKVAIKIRQDGKQGGKATPANAASQTVLGGVNSVDFPHVFAAKEEMRSWRFLQLNPEDLRQPTSKKTGEDTITSTGKNLAAALFRIKQADSYNLVEISRKLNSFLPNFTKVDVLDDTENRQYIIKLTGDDGKIFSSRVLSEGTLRLLTLCILEYDEKYTGLLCFEEPENGIHPFRIKAMVELLKSLSSDFDDRIIPLRQILVNTHSPVLIGYLLAYKDDINVSIWYTQMRTLSTQIKTKRMKLNITKNLPVLNNNAVQQEMIFSSEQDRKLTLANVKEYLQTADFGTIESY